jgi:uncharacterized protein (DUF1800 family)
MFTFAPRFHDDGPKTVFGQSGPWDGTDVQRLILARADAARFIIRKLYRELVAEAPEPTDALLEPLAEQFRHSDYDVGALVGTILRSRQFFSEYAYRQRVKSPVEYAVGIVRAVRPTTTPRELVATLEAMGQSLFAPPNVKGWPGGRKWLNSATVLARQNFAQSMTALQGAEPKPPAAPAATEVAQVLAEVEVKPPGNVPAVPQNGPPEGIVLLVEGEKVTEPAAVVNLLAELLLQGDIAEETRTKLTAFFADGKPEKTAWRQRVCETAHALMTLPEYTLA